MYKKKSGKKQGEDYLGTSAELGYPSNFNADDANVEKLDNLTECKTVKSTKCNPHHKNRIKESNKRSCCYNHPCEICAITFESPALLQDHLRVKHKIMDNSQQSDKLKTIAAKDGSCKTTPKKSRKMKCATCRCLYYMEKSNPLCKRCSKKTETSNAQKDSDDKSREEDNINVSRSSMSSPPKSTAKAVKSAGRKRKAVDVNCVSLIDEFEKLPNNSCIVISKGSRFQCVKCGYLAVDVQESSRHCKCCFGSVGNKVICSRAMRWLCLTCCIVFEECSHLVAHKELCALTHCASSTTTKETDLKSKLRKEYEKSVKYWCSKCGYGCTSPFSLKDHCCEKRLKQMQSLVVSLKPLPSDAALSIVMTKKCDICQKTFTGSNSHQDHLQDSPICRAGGLHRNERRKRLSQDNFTMYEKTKVKEEPGAFANVLIKEEALDDSESRSLANYNDFRARYNSRFYTCQCNEVFYQLEHFEIHVSLRHTQNNSDDSDSLTERCTDCNALFHTELALKMHACSRVASTAVNEPNALFQGLNVTEYQSNQTDDAPLHSIPLPDGVPLFYSTVQPSISSAVMSGSSFSAVAGDSAAVCATSSPLESQAEGQGPNHSDGNSGASRLLCAPEKFPVIYNVKSLAVSKSNNDGNSKSIKLNFVSFSENPVAWAMLNRAEVDSSLYIKMIVCRCFAGFDDEDGFIDHLSECHGTHKESVDVHVMINGV